MGKMRSNSKRKWIVGGVMFFSGIGLLTTGFATWVIGNNVLNHNQDIQATVDSATSNVVTMSAKVAPEGEGFYLGEPTSHQDGDIVNVTNGKATDLKIVFTEVNLQCGDENFNKHFKGNTKFSLKLEKKQANGLDDSAFDANNVAAEGNLIDAAEPATSIRNGSSWTYLNLDPITKEFTPGNAGISEWGLSGSVHTLKLTGVEFEFSWGSFFANQSPAAFYNANKAELSDLAKYQAIEQELNNMNTALNGVTLPFVLSLVPGTAL